MKAGSTEQRPSARARLMKAMGLAKRAPARLPGNMRAYAVGDIHGCARLLDIMHERIAEDAKDAPSDKHIVYLGDYIDRGHDSKGVIDRVTKSVPAGFTAHYIKGNHDAALLDFLEDPETYRAWRSFGAADTLLSYHVRPPLFDSEGQRIAARDALRKALPQDHLAFFRGLELKVTLGDYVFVHAGVRPGIPLEGQSEEDLLWIRDEFLSSTEPHGKVVVHGHTPLNAPVHTSNRISVDTGAYATGVLTCAMLEGTTCRFLQARV
jgi:serine/threonine protein phosphatase 1